MVKILIPKESPFDAINFYLDIVRSGLELKGEKVTVINSINDIDKDDTVITVWALSFFEVFFKKRPRIIVNWFQGIQSEETFLWFQHSRIEKHLRRFAWRMLERFTLKYAHGSIFVSDAMRQFFKDEYGFKKNNFFVMPCFNSVLHKESFEFPEKYSRPSFVYAGGMSEWQCIDATLLLYKELKNRIPLASLTLLTGDGEQAADLIRKYALEDVSIKYVPYKEINAELKKYKYGFLLRKDIAINHVATPTKMSTYLANGIIPVYSNVIGDFKDVFKDMKYVVRLDETMDIQKMTDQLMKMESEELSLSAVYQEYKSVFEGYYATETYINSIETHPIFNK